MEEHLAFGADAVALLFLLSSLFLFSRRSDRAGLITGSVALMLIAGSTIVRAYPDPTYTSLQSVVSRLEAEKLDLEARLSKAETEAKELGRELQSSKESSAILQEELTKVRASSARTLQRLLRGGLAMQRLSVTPMEQTELVSGHKGQHYTIRFRDPSGDAFIFTERRYELPPEAERNLSAAIEDFANTIWPMLAGARGYHLFARGGADARDFEEVGTSFDAFRVLEQKRVGQYDAERPVEKTYAGLIRNEHMPDLRASYLTNVIGKTVASLKIAAILHSQPTSTPYAIDRTVELILVVDW